MIKLLCLPVTKILLFFGGFAAAIFTLRSANVTFDRAVAFAFDENVAVASHAHTSFFYGRGFSFFAFCFSICFGLLLVSVWKSTPKKQKAKIFHLWRNLDFFLLIILVALVAVASFYGLRGIYAQHGAVFRVQIYVILGLPLLAYTAAMLTAFELMARLRDKDLMRTLYWVRFFRLYPIWKPLGLFLSLLLIGSLVVLVVTMQEIVAQATAQPIWINFEPEVVEAPIFTDIESPAIVFDRFDHPIADYRWRERTILMHQLSPPIVQPELLLSFSLLSLLATTYFVTFALNLSRKYAEASAEKVRAERFKSELITNVSHDIRTPLTSVINYVDLLKKLSLEGDAVEYVAVLDRKSDRLKMLIDDLIDASKASTGSEDVSMQSVNLSEIVGQIAGECEDSFIARDLTLVLRQADEPRFIHADNRHLWRVLENLFSNASKYALPGTRVFAEIASDDGGKPRFTLKNTSQVPLDLSGDALTEQFIRGDLARQSEGSGLGLYIAKNLVELMEGAFHIHITGDLFEVELVFAQPPDATI